MHLDWTISIGTLIHLSVILIGGGAAYAGIKSRIDRHGEIITDVRSDIREIKNDLIRGLDARLRAVEIATGKSMGD